MIKRLLQGTVVAALAADAAAAFRPTAVELHQGTSTGGEPAGRGRRLSATGLVEMADCENLEYTGVIGLGTPVQEFRVVFSIASSYLWVVGSECLFCGSASRGYDSSLSSTYEKNGSPFSIAGAGGQAEAIGRLSVDLLSVGGVSTTITFGEMIEANLEGCTQVDGKLGMGLANDGETNAFENLLEAGAVDTPVFSFYMGNIDTGSPKGVLTLGGVNQTHYEGCLEWIPISKAQDGTSDLPSSVPPGFWSIVVKDLKIGSESVIRSPATGVLDTGSSLIIGPYDDVGALADKIGAMCVHFTTSMDSALPTVVGCTDDASIVDLIIMDCDAEFDDINFYLGGKDFALTPNELLQPLDDFGPPIADTATDPMCLFGMIGADLVDTWILGDPFLRTFYTSYNVKEKTVGIAKAASCRTSKECAADAKLSSELGTACSSNGDGGNGGGDDVDDSPDDADSSSTGGDELDGSSAVATGGSNSGDQVQRSKRTSTVSALLSAGLAAMALLGCGLIVGLTVRKRWKTTLERGGAYRPTALQVDCGGAVFEMSSGGKAASSSANTTMAARHGGEAADNDKDFLQASPRAGLTGGGEGHDGSRAGATGGRVLDKLLGGGPARTGTADWNNTV